VTVRWTTPLGAALAVALALASAACRQTVFLEYDGSLGGSGGGGGNSFDAGDGGSVLACTGSIELTPEASEAIFALDRSMGMMSAKLSDTTAFAAARDAIDQYASLYQTVISFGYVEFPADPYVFNYCTGSMQQQICCSSPLSQPSMNFSLFHDAFTACDAAPPAQYCSMGNYQRPSVPALTSCYSSFIQRSNHNKRYVLLITNGAPDCGTNSGSGCTDASMVASQLSMVKARTHVFVPGQIDSGTTDCLGKIAQQGGATTPPYYHPSTTAADLGDDIGGVTRVIAMDACRLDLPPSARPLSSADGLALVWKDMQIPYADRTSYDGWDIPGNGNGFTIELSGSWCERWIEDGQGTFTLRTGCELIHH
jgi:hypothetical protein